MIRREECPLRVDIAGGWQDCEQFAQPGGHVVNVAISPLVTLEDLKTGFYSGLGGSAARALLEGSNGVVSELAAGAGWQDPAVILETGLCVWKSGAYPVLEMKVNPWFLQDKMALLWTGSRVSGTVDILDKPRDMKGIFAAGQLARSAAQERSLRLLARAVALSYEAQLKEGMPQLLYNNELAKKYCGAGWGGNALYLFEETRQRDNFVSNVEHARAVEPYMERFG